MIRQTFACKMQPEPSSSLEVGDLVVFVLDPGENIFRVTAVLPDGLVRLHNEQGNFPVGRAKVTELARL